MSLTFEQLPQAVTQLSNKLDNIERLLMQRGTLPQPETDQLLTVPQTAEFLSLSVPTVYGLVSRAELPVNKRGKRLYFSKQELTDWIKQGRKKTLSETATEAEAYLTDRKKGGLK